MFFGFPAKFAADPGFFVFAGWTDGGNDRRDGRAAAGGHERDQNNPRATNFPEVTRRRAAAYHCRIIEATDGSFNKVIPGSELTTRDGAHIV
jgi:hypothetical protein